MEKKYRALRLISVILKVLAWISLIGGILGALGVMIMGILGAGAMARAPEMGSLAPMMTGGGVLAGIVSGLGILIGSVISFVSLFASSEAIHIVIAIEHNTRECAYYLKGETAYDSTPTYNG